MIYDVNSGLFRSFLSQKGSSSDKRKMEDKPRGGGRYIVAFDKEPSFEATYRIIDKVEVKKFLAKMIDSKKMQYSYKNEKNKYNDLTISRLKEQVKELERIILCQKSELKKFQTYRKSALEQIWV